MIDRRYWYAAVLLAVLAIATQVLVWLARPPANEQTYSGPPRSDYTLTDFTLRALDAEGRLSFVVSGPRLTRRGADDSLDVDAPKFVIIDGGGHPWHGDSASAWVNTDGSLMRLDGKVQMQRDATPQLKPVTILTADLTAWPKDKRMLSAAPTRIIQPGSILRGIGMKADLDAHTLDLLADVHGQFQPKTPPR